jgi:salicylate hydroxylase
MFTSQSNPSFKPLDVAVIGSGLGGLSAAITLRRQGHKITIYERRDFGGEVGASLSCASNGSKFLEEWGIDTLAAKPVILRSLIMHDWKSGMVINQYGLGDYKARFGTNYNNFHRIDLHVQLKETALARGCVLQVWHKATSLDPENGIVRFENGNTVRADLVVCADGIRSQMREQMGVTPKVDPSTSCCYRCIISADRLRELGLEEFLHSEAIEFWGGTGIYKIVMSSCSNGDVVSCYCFYPAA